jgi:murein DD-endopeptidase MepM/ murein hydrolase activator NlpD
VVDRRRYASHARFGALVANGPPPGLSQLRRGRAASTFKDLYETDHAEQRQGGRFRWLVSTCLAGMVGAVSIFVVIYGSADQRAADGGFLPALSSMGDTDIAGRGYPFSRSRDGLRWAVPKSDRLQVTSGAVTVRYLIHESHKQRRAGREYIQAKPYVRIVGRLAPVPSDQEHTIPDFNPLKLYAVEKQDEGGRKDQTSDSGDARISVNVLELLDGVLPVEDGQTLDEAEAAQHVARAKEAEAEAERFRAGAEAEADRWTGAESTGALGPDGMPPANTTILTKPPQDEGDSLADLEGREAVVVKVGANDSLRKLLVRAGADNWQARGMIEAARKIFPPSRLQEGQEMRITLVPSLTKKNRKEPARFSIFSSGHEHLVSVARNAAGEFVASKSHAIEKDIANAALGYSDKASKTSSVYASVYYAGLLQHIPKETIMKIMKIHAFETDFRRRLRPGDAVEFFFDMREDPSPDAPPGELLYTAITTGGETYRFYRFRTPDGEVDYYDENGNNSKKFLMRRPVRGENVRLTSGFGMRYHPLLNEKRMHSGVDWATAPGTPILAAGTGVIEKAGRKGQYGNYVRIRHPNGYHTAYAHMLRFKKGIKAGAKVRQGEVIGYVGTTGLSSGPHLHYEVLINKRRVDPLSMQVPRERQLTGRVLAEFHKERLHIDDLRHSAPVMTASK